MKAKIATRRVSFLLLLFTLFACGVQPSLGQTPTTFAYQGRLTDGGTPANAPYDLQFTLYNSGGTVIGSPLVRAGVTVANGVFTVQLDFGASVFANGQASTLEIGVRPGGSTGAFTILGPRQPITATPYAIQTLNATQLGGVDASQYITTTNGATNFIQNTTAPQAGANFNISGNGTLNTLDVNGAAAPPAAPAGRGRIYFDFAANKFRASENGGAFIDLIGSGGVSGTGTTNAIPLWTGGTALGNSVITQSAAGVQLPNAVQLALGAQGNGVQFGSPNGETGMTISGTSGRADLRFDGLLKLVAGPAGQIPPATNGIAIDTAGNVGIGNFAPQGKLVVNAGGSGGEMRFHTPNGESGMSIIGTNRADVRFDGQTLKLLAGTGAGAMASTNGVVINAAGNVGIGTTTPQVKLDVAGSGAMTGSLSVGNGVTVANGLRVNSGGVSFILSGVSTGGSYDQNICRNLFTGALGQCSSSLRYKSNVETFGGGLDILTRLRPISFTWKHTGQRDVGFGAEEVFQVEPLLTTHNEAGEIEGVKYTQLSVVFVNAIKEQQAQINQQQSQIETFQTANLALDARLRAVEERLRKKVSAARRWRCPAVPPDVRKVFHCQVQQTRVCRTQTNR